MNSLIIYTTLTAMLVLLLAPDTQGAVVKKRDIDAAMFDDIPQLQNGMRFRWGKRTRADPFRWSIYGRTGDKRDAYSAFEGPGLMRNRWG